MKKLISILIFCLSIMSFKVWAENDCNSCRGAYIEGEKVFFEFCYKMEPSGCNTCTAAYSCRKDENGNEHWQREGFTICTLMYCGGMEIEVENPFKDMMKELR